MSKKCPKCTKAVYMAEWIQCSGQCYHKACFKCTNCDKSLTQGKQKEKNDSIYCDACFTKLFPITGSKAAVAKPGSTGEGDKCPVCGKTVYQAEQVKTEQNKYHQECFLCVECKTHLTLGKQKEKDGSVYCEPCFIKKYPIIGAAPAVGKPGSTGEGDKCPVCGNTVYQAEQVKTEQNKYHKDCFVCIECKTHLTLGNQKEKDGSVYCESCFIKKFPVIGAAPAVAQPGNVGEGEKCPVCGKAVFQAERLATEVARYHPACFICHNCKTRLELGKQKEKDDAVYCESCYNHLFRATGYNQGLTSFVALGTAPADPDEAESG